MNRYSQIFQGQKPSSSRQKNKYELYTCICQNATCIYLRASGKKTKPKQNKETVENVQCTLFFTETSIGEFLCSPVLWRSKFPNIQEVKICANVIHDTNSQLGSALAIYTKENPVSVFRGTSCTCKPEHKFLYEQTNH